MVQVYVESPDQKEIRRLVGVAPVQLAAGKSKNVTIALAEDTYKRRDWKGDFYELDGKHTIYVGFSQPDERSVALTGVEILSREIVIKAVVEK